MKIDTKHHVIACLFGFVVFALLAYAVSQYVGNVSLVLNSGLGGFFVVGVGAFPFAFASYFVLRYLLARRAGIKYQGPLGKAIRESVAHEIERGGRVRS